MALLIFPFNTIRNFILYADNRFDSQRRRRATVYCAMVQMELVQNRTDGAK